MHVSSKRKDPRCTAFRNPSPNMDFVGMFCTTLELRRFPFASETQLGKRIVETIFQPGHWTAEINCSGTRGKMLLDQGKLGIVRKYVFKLYPCRQAQEDAQWRKCIVAIDEYLRRAH